MRKQCHSPICQSQHFFKKFLQIPFWNHKHILPYSHVYTYENPVCEITPPFGCRSRRGALLLGGAGEVVCKGYSLQLDCSLTR